MTDRLEEASEAIQAAVSSYHNAMYEVTKIIDATQATIRSPDQTIEVVVNGDLSLDSVTIKPGSFSKHTAKSLGDTIRTTYDAALAAMNQHIFDEIEGAFPDPEESPDASMEAPQWK